MEESGMNMIETDCGTYIRLLVEGRIDVTTSPKLQAQILNCFQKKNEFNFEKEEQLIEDTIGFIKTFRNIKQENNITKDLKVKLNNTEDYSLIKNMLKLNENIIEDKMNITEYKVNYGRFSASIYYEKEITEEDILQKEKQIETLKQNILKRENLLSNENFVNKAPEKLVNEERTKLDSDKKMLELLTK